MIKEIGEPAMLEMLIRTTDRDTGGMNGGN